MSGTGSAGMETLLVNLLEPGERVLVCVNGVFGTRMADVAARCGAEVHTLEIPWGTVFEHDAIVAEGRDRQAGADRDRARRNVDRRGSAAGGVGRRAARARVAVGDGLCHEPRRDAGARSMHGASTRPTAARRNACPARPAWRRSPVAPRAVEKLDKRQTKVQSWYLDLTHDPQLLGRRHGPIITPPRSTCSTASMRRWNRDRNEGLEARFARHRASARGAEGGPGAAGAGLCQPGRASPAHAECRQRFPRASRTMRQCADGCLTSIGIEIGGGLGAFKGKAWRIGLMGYNARVGDRGTGLSMP